LTNAEIADRLMSLAQLLSAQRENPFKVKAYRRAAKTIRTLPESIEELVRSGSNLTEYSGIGQGISGAIQEIVFTGALRKLDTLREQVTPELAAINEYPRLDPQRVVRIFKKLNISSIDELKGKLDSGEIARALGARMDQHVRQALTERREMLLYDADDLVAAVERFLLRQCGARRAQVTGDYRRRVEVISEIAFLIETDNFPAVVSKLERYGGKADLLSTT
jgi:DNA polymerase (family 10)